MFATDFIHTNRETKARYVALKYAPILRGVKILDVGADQCHLKTHLADGTEYTGIDIGGSPDRLVDLERDPIPFECNSFDVVLCLDVLEHLDNIHDVFDQLCRITRRYVIISLPNPWADFYDTLRFGHYQPDQPMKFYGLPVERPLDRHKWFFSTEEAERFVLYRAAQNGMRVVQLDRERDRPRDRRFWRRWARWVLLRRDVAVSNLYATTLWAVIEKQR